MGRRAMGWFSLAVLPGLLLLNLVTSHRVLELGPVRPTVFDLVALAFVGVGFAIARWLPGRRVTWAATWPVTATFGVLLAWAAVTGIGRSWQVSLPERGPELFTLPAWVAYVPLGEAALALGFAWVAVATVEAGRIEGSLFALCALMLACGVVGEARALTDLRIDQRLDTGLGGAAVLPVVLILVCATAWGLSASGYRPAWSNALVAIAVVELLLTGSRAGSIMLVVMLGLIAVRWFTGVRRSVRAILRAGAVIVVGLAGAGVLLWSFPELRRILQPTDLHREQNFVTAWGIVTHDWGRVIWGMGTGVVWPWYAADANILPGQEPTPWSWVTVPYSDGWLLGSPHSLFLGVFVELGLVGLAILGVQLVLVALGAWRARRHPLAGMMLLGSLATIAAFPFDHYLLRNFGVSWMWWLFLFSALRLGRETPPEPRLAARWSAP